MKKLTVITYLHKNETQFERCIKGLESQSFKEFEWIIASHQQPKQTINIDYRFFQLPVHIEVKSDVLNLILPEIKSQYIAYNDSDDLSFPNRFKLQIELMDENQDIDICSGMFFINNTENTWPMHQFHDMISAYLLINSPMCNPAIILRNKPNFWGKVVQYNPYFLRAQDYDFWFSCLKNNLKFHNLQVQLISYYVPQQTTNQDKQADFAKEIRNSILKYANLNIELLNRLEYHEFCSLKKIPEQTLFELLNYLNSVHYKKPFQNTKNVILWLLDIYQKYYPIENQKEFEEICRKLSKKSIFSRLLN